MCGLELCKDIFFEMDVAHHDLEHVAAESAALGSRLVMNQVGLGAGTVDQNRCSIAHRLP